ncbi:dTMP kinase [Streptomyces sp. NPDC091972]|uniref:dTMP kinase n=1 Tax=Streptomyces sp. NPDC091972 TaxID=3366007 RepID=UPI00382BE6A9
MIIALEGIDGAGKTTTAALVAQQLTEHGHSVVSTSKRNTAVREPFAREQLQALAERLWGVPHDARLNAVGSLHWVFLNASYFAATHYALSAELGVRRIAVMDNWINKLVARMASNGEFKLDELLQMLAPLPQPDLVVMLDVSPEAAAGRREFSDAERGLLASADSTFETFQAIVRDNLLLMADHYHWDVITPGEATADEVASEVVRLVEGRLPD